MIFRHYHYGADLGGEECIFSTKDLYLSGSSSHMFAAWEFRGESMLASAKSDCMDCKMVFTLYAADHFSLRISRQILPY